MTEQTLATKPVVKDSLLRFENVSKTFMVNGDEVQALKSVNCSLQRGGLNIITGPSGSGKSTMLDTLIGLQPPSEGRVILLGEDIYKLSTDSRAYYRARMLGMVYQANYWVKSLTVLENVAMPLYLGGYDRENAALLAEMSLDSVGMMKYAHYLPHILSGGQQQRVSMARALVANPEVIVADEPTGNLDTYNGALIMDLLRDCVKSRGKTVILVTHNLQYLVLGDNNIFIKDGVLTEGMSNTEIATRLGSFIESEITDKPAPDAMTPAPKAPPKKVRL